MKLVELTNGRAAMFGCAFIFVIAITANSNIIENLDLVDLQSIWLALGIYAG